MANKGLRKENTMLEFELDEIKVSVDLAKDNKNIIAYIPLSLNIGPKPINVGIYYNNQDSNITDKFGEGFRFTNYKRIEYSYPYYYVYNSDGSQERFSYSSQTSDDMTYENEENKSIIYISYEDEYDSYTIYDKYGNHVDYYEDNLTYIKTLFHRGEDYYVFYNTLSFIRVINSYNYELKYNIAGNVVTSFEYKEGNNTLYTGTISYNNNKITSITITKGSTVVKDISIDYSYGIQFTDNITSKVLNFEMTEDDSVNPPVNRIKVVEGYANNLTTTTIDYKNKKTIVTNHLNQTKTYFFDNDYMLEQIIDDNYFVSTYSYDDTICELLYESKEIYQKVTNDSSILSFNNQDFDFLTSTITMQEISDNNIDIDYQELLTKMYQNTNSGVLWCTKSVNGIALDSYSLVLWIKKVSGTGTFKVIFNSGGVGDEIILNDVNIPTNFYKMIYLGVTNYVAFNHIGINIYITGDLKVQFGRVEIINANLKTKYSYANTNLTEVEDEFSYSNNSYNSSNLVDGSFGTTKNSTLYTYTSSNKVSKEIMPYGIEKNYTYVDNQKTKEELKSDDTLIWEENYSYTNHELTTLSNKYNKNTTYSYLNHNLVQVIDSLNNSIYYTYDNYDEINGISQNPFHPIYIVYNSIRLISSVTTPEYSNYTYVYDSKNRVKQVIFNDVKLEEYTYYSNDLLETITRGVDVYKIEYDSKYRIEFIKLNGVAKYKFIYDGKSRIANVQMLDEQNNYQNIKEYFYDEKDNVSQFKQRNFKLDCIYHQNNLAYKIHNINDNKIYLESVGFNSLIAKNPLYFENYITSTPNFAGTSFNYGLSLKSFDEVISPETAVYGSNPKAVINSIHAIDTTSGKAILSYQGGKYQSDDTRSVGIAMWININTVYNDSHLFTIRQDNMPNYSKVYCYLYGNTIRLRILNSTGNLIGIFNKEVNFTTGKWHFIGFSYEYYTVEDDDNFVDRYIYRFNIDGKSYEETFTLEQYQLGTIEDAKYYIGCKIDNNGQNRFVGYITALSISNGRVFSNDDLSNYYDFSKAFIIKNDDSFGIVNFSSTIEYGKTLLSNYDIIPLHSNVISLKGKRPKAYSFLKSGKFVFNGFTYNDSIKGTSFSPGAELTYDLEFSTQGTTILNVNYDILREKCYIIQHVFNNGGMIALYLNNNKLMLEIKNYTGVESIIVDSGLTLSKNIWYAIGLSYSYSNGVVYYKIFKDNSVVSGQRSINQSMTYIHTNIGRSEWYSGIDYQEFKGNVSMLVFKSGFIDSTEYNYIKNNLLYYRENNYYDKYNHLIQKQIKKNNAQILTTNYSYDKDRVISETINFNITREYSYSDNGNIVTISDNDFGSHTYTYDSLNRVTSDNSTTYSYDLDGNIIAVGSTTYGYDSLKRLTSIGNYSITYGEITTPLTNNVFLPLTYKNYYFYYDGKRLKEIVINDIDEIIHVKYFYDEQGLLIKRIETHHDVNEYTDTDFTSEYFYDNQGRLIAEIYDGSRCDYLYGETGVYGLIINMTNRYYYIKDITGTIIGICDQTGTIIGKYDYDAFGNIISNTVSIHNSIIYKEYLFDYLAKMYYLKSRFYNPEWRRFLTPDSLDYIDYQDLNGINLYAYCKNNPVMNVDPEGHFTLLGLMIGLGVSLAFEFLEDALDGNGFDHDFKDYLGAGISGVFGALGGNFMMRASFSLAGGLIDGWLSGDIRENGIGRTLISIASSFLIGEAVSGLSSFISNKVQIGKLTADAHANKQLLKGLGIKYSFNKNGKSYESFVKAIKTSKWTSKMIAQYTSSSATSNLTSTLIGLI